MKVVEKVALKVFLMVSMMVDYRDGWKADC